LQERFQLRRDAGRDVVSAGDDAVAHELMGFLGVDLVQATPVLAQSGKRFRGKRAGKNQRRLVIQRTQTGIEVVAVRIYQLQRHHRNRKPGHGRRKLLEARLGGAEAVSCVNARPIRMPKQIAVAFESIIAQIDVEHLVAPLAVPLHIEPDFALARGIQHAAGNDELAHALMPSHKNLVRGEHHVFEAGNRIDGFDHASALLQRRAQSLPLAQRPLAIDGRVARHVRVFGVNHVEVSWRAQQDAVGRFLRFVGRGHFLRRQFYAPLTRRWVARNPMPMEMWRAASFNASRMRGMVSGFT